MDSILQTFQSDYQDVQTALGQYIVTPANAFGLAGFIFGVEGASIVNINADITDHYAEDNSVIQDHIAVKPKRFVLKQYIGELADFQNDSNPSVVQSVVQKLTTLSNTLPALASGTKQVLGFFGGDFPITASSLTQPALLQSASSLFATVKNLIQQPTKQSAAYMYFKALMQQKILVSVQTPFEFMANMAIESIVAIQPEETKQISDFTITLKEMRFAPVKTTLFNSNTFYSGSQTPDQITQVNPSNLGMSTPINQAGQGLLTPVPAGGFQALMNNPALQTK